MRGKLEVLPVIWKLPDSQPRLVCLHLGLISPTQRPPEHSLSTTFHLTTPLIALTEYSIGPSELASTATILREQALNRRNWNTAIMGSPTVIYHPAVAHFLRYVATTGTSLAFAESYPIITRPPR